MRTLVPDARSSWRPRHLLGRKWIDKTAKVIAYGLRGVARVLDLAHLGLTIPQYLEKLERSLIDYLHDLGIDSHPGEPGLTGVWSGGKKLAAIGKPIGQTFAQTFGDAPMSMTGTKSLNGS